MPLRAWLVSHIGSRQPIDSGSDVDMNPLADEAARKIVEGATESTGAGLVDLQAALKASPETYRYRNEVQSYYEDGQHLTLAGGQAALYGLVLPSPWNK
jgi:hypothetical protein